jgi:hypothetical protein
MNNYEKLEYYKIKMKYYKSKLDELDGGVVPTATATAATATATAAATAPTARKGFFSFLSSKKSGTTIDPQKKAEEAVADAKQKEGDANGILLEKQTDYQNATSTKYKTEDLKKEKIEKAKKNQNIAETKLDIAKTKLDIAKTELEIINKKPPFDESISNKNLAYLKLLLDLHILKLLKLEKSEKDIEDRIKNKSTSVNVAKTELKLKIQEKNPFPDELKNKKYLTLLESLLAFQKLELKVLTEKVTDDIKIQMNTKHAEMTKLMTEFKKEYPEIKAAKKAAK